jgi:hypothetical protein
MFEEGVKYSCFGLLDVREAPGQLLQRLHARAAFEQDGKPGRKAGPIGSGFAMDQNRPIGRMIDIVEPQDTIPVRRATAFKRKKYVLDAEVLAGREC